MDTHPLSHPRHSVTALTSVKPVTAVTTVTAMTCPRRKHLRGPARPPGSAALSPLALAVWALALVSLSSLPLGASGAPAKMKCADWAWATCVDLGFGAHVLSLNPDGGAAMMDDNHFLSGSFEMDIKLTPGYSGGTIFAFYLMDTLTKNNKEEMHSEIDIEFYGNATSKTVQMNLNVFAGGHQNLAIYNLPWDPAEKFHTYGITFDARQIIWTLDGWPIRVVRKMAGDPWPTFAMQPQVSVWHSGWTPLQPQFDNGPIAAMFQNYRARGCTGKDDAQLVGAGRCPGPWNAPLSNRFILGYQRLHKAHLLNEWGWDLVQ